MKKTNQGLVEWARAWLGRPYWYGCVCYECTENLLARKAKQYPKHYTDARMPRYRADIAAGRWATDCIGLAKGYMWYDDEAGRSKYASNGCPDASANGMYEKATVKGKMATLPELPGVMLWKPGHAGIYIGDGRVIEARGFDYGVVETELSKRGWQGWYRLPGCEYVEVEQGAGAARSARVRITGNRVNIRRGPGTQYGIIDCVDKGTEYLDGNPEGWHAVKLPDGIGYVSPKYSEVVE